MRNKFIPFSPPWIGEEEINEVVDTLKSDWITTGPKVIKFEEEFCRYFNSPSALALNSCTAALHTALVTLGIGPGDEVVTTPMTFCASVNVIEHVGAKPVLVDVESDTLNIDPNKIESAITNKTKAILPVHYSGHPVELDTIYDIAEKYNLYVVEDAAHAIHAKYKGRFIGSSNNPVCFSFYATKNLTTAEGGMLTGDPDFIERARIISLHGMSKDAWKRYSKEGSWYYEVVYPGFKYNMTDIQASIGLWQLNKLESFQRRRREIVNMYNSAFKDIEALRTPIERPEVEHSWHLYVLRLNLEMLRIDRNQFIEELKNRNIGTSVHFIPIHLHPYYRDKYGFKPNDFPVAYENYLKIISLPLYPRMSNEDVYDVIEAVIDVVKKYRR
uniref:DegT/DnrJ/EryC1/StrS aminotransferase family protein n=1 Tax=Dictyoglomus thermophilum TaxID=14 RepID=A0A7V4DWU7_DICTH